MRFRKMMSTTVAATAAGLFALASINAMAHTDEYLDTQQAPNGGQLRMAGVAVQMHAGSGEGLGSMKSQFKKADASGARYALIFGADELARGEVTVKSLRDGVGAQTHRALADAAAWAGHLQSKA